MFDDNQYLLIPISWPPLFKDMHDNISYIGIFFIYLITPELNCNVFWHNLIYMYYTNLQAVYYTTKAFLKTSFRPQACTPVFAITRRIKVFLNQISLKSIQWFSHKNVTDRQNYFRIFNIRIDWVLKKIWWNNLTYIPTMFSITRCRYRLWAHHHPAYLRVRASAWPCQALAYWLRPALYRNTLKQRLLATSTQPSWTVQFYLRAYT